MKNGSEIITLNFLKISVIIVAIVISKNTNKWLIVTETTLTKTYQFFFTYDVTVLVQQQLIDFHLQPPSRIESSETSEAHCRNPESFFCPTNRFPQKKFTLPLLFSIFLHVLGKKTQRKHHSPRADLNMTSVCQRVR